MKKADILAQSDYQRKEKLEALDGYHKIYDKIIEDADCLTLKDLALNGRDLIELGVKPGPQIGNILANRKTHKDLCEFVVWRGFCV